MILYVTMESLDGVCVATVELVLSDGSFGALVERNGNVNYFHNNKS